MCFFNSDIKTGRNSKTYRMKPEKEYMDQNSFITSSATLNKSLLTDIHVFYNHFYYIDEYDFNDTTPEMMKTINKKRRSYIFCKCYVSRIKRSKEQLYVHIKLP